MNRLLLGLWLLLLSGCAQSQTTLTETPAATPTVPPAWVGNSAELALGSVPFEQLTESDRNRFQAEQFNLRTFDATQALLLPAGDEGTVAFQQHALKDAARWSLLYDWGLPMISLGDYAIFRRSDWYADPALRHVETLVEHRFEGDGYAIVLRGVSAEIDANTLILRSLWQQQGAPAAVTLAAELHTPNDTVQAAWRGIGADPTTWQADDLLLQLTTLPLPSASDGPLMLAVGVQDTLIDVMYLELP